MATISKIDFINTIEALAEYDTYVENLMPYFNDDVMDKMFSIEEVTVRCLEKHFSNKIIDKSTGESDIWRYLYEEHEDISDAEDLYDKLYAEE